MKVVIWVNDNESDKQYELCFNSVNKLVENYKKRDLLIQTDSLKKYIIAENLIDTVFIGVKPDYKGFKGGK